MSEAGRGPALMGLPLKSGQTQQQHQHVSERKEIKQKECKWLWEVPLAWGLGKSPQGGGMWAESGLMRRN